MHFYSSPVPHSKLQVKSFENLFLPKIEGVDEAMICSIKIQLEDMKMTWNISLFTFCMVFNFSKGDGFTVL